MINKHIFQWFLNTAIRRTIS